MIYLKNALLQCMLPLMATCILLCSGCTENYYNYPKKVFIPSEGGEVTIDGDEWPISILFLRKDTYVNGTFTYDEDRKAHGYEYEWLTVETIEFESKITFIAPPNEATRQRSITIEPNFPNNDYCSIKITQGGK